MLTRHRLLAGVSALAAASFALPAWAQDTIKLGELNSYKASAGVPRALQEGLGAGDRGGQRRGRRHRQEARIVSRDDNGNPGDAVRVAEELVSREKVDFLTGTFLQRRPRGDRLRQAEEDALLAGEPLTDKIVWDNGNRYTFRLRPRPTCRRRCWFPRRPSSRRSAGRSSIPNYEYGQSAAAAFKQLLKAEAARRRVRRRAGAAARQDRRRRGGAGAGRRQARRDLQRRCSAPTSPSSCARATRAACSRAATWSAC